MENPRNTFFPSSTAPSLQVSASHHPSLGFRVYSLSLFDSIPSLSLTPSAEFQKSLILTQIFFLSTLKPWSMGLHQALTLKP
jgi:hypothetical protein